MAPHARARDQQFAGVSLLRAVVLRTHLGTGPKAQAHRRTCIEGGDAEEALPHVRGAGAGVLVRWVCVARQPREWVLGRCQGGEGVRGPASLEMDSESHTKFGG
eukprot:COSAG02_NODE_1066_length_14828_cov_8.021794_4_plen_104_part_00